MGLPHNALRWAALAALARAAPAQRCATPAAAGSHVLYNASLSVGGAVEHLATLRYLHAVVDQVSPMYGACAGDRVEWSGAAEGFPEEFRHRSKEKGAKVLAEIAHVTSPDDYRLIDALKTRAFDRAAKLINEDRVGVNARDDNGVPALSVAIQLRQPVLAASLLNAFEPRVEVDAATPQGYTALHFAVGSNDRNVVKALLRRGADPNAQIRQPQSGGWAPLHFACRLGHLEIAKSLLLGGFAGENAFKVAEDAAVPYATRKKTASLLNEAMARRGGDPPPPRGEL